MLQVHLWKGGGGRMKGVGIRWVCARGLPRVYCGGGGGCGAQGLFYPIEVMCCNSFRGGLHWLLLNFVKSLRGSGVSEVEKEGGWWAFTVLIRRVGGKQGRIPEW